MGALDKVLLAAGLDDDEAAVSEAHEFLLKQCPWYVRVGEERCCSDPDEHCKPAGGTVSLTPHTAEASTVPKPTVPPGGPGLFHVKGLELPPYIQHLWVHLVKEYGKHKAYGVAVGIVKKWKAGIAPGGKKGKGGKARHVHPDVQAAAAKNIAQWEADKVRAHRQSRERERVKATRRDVVHIFQLGPHEVKRIPSAGHDPAAPTWFYGGETVFLSQARDLEIMFQQGNLTQFEIALTEQGPPFPGQATIALPPVPGTKVAKSMYTAHRINDILLHLSHAAERLVQAKQGRALRGYHMMHVNNHLSHALNEAHDLVASVRKNYLPEARELAALNKTMGLAASVSQDAKVATFAHLLQTLLYHEAHAKRHAECMLNPDPDPVWKFNYEHAHTHLKGAVEHCLQAGPAPPGQLPG